MPNPSLDPSPGNVLRWQRASRSGAAHFAATVVFALGVACLPLIATPRFYFHDDTQSSAVGAWYEVGRYLVEQHTVPFLIPGRYMAGNILVEGQWAILNPLALVVSAAAYLSGELLLVATVCKLVTLAILAGGVYLVARSYGVTPRWSAGAGMVAPFIGFTMYFDAPSWVTGLWVFAGLPWTWWALRRFRLAGGLPLLPFAFGYLVITVGYVHGTIMLAAMILGVILEAWLERDRRRIPALLGVGVALGLLAAVVFLPGVLSARVTWRSGSIGGNDNYLSPEPAVLLASYLPSYRPWISMFWGVGAVAAPLGYVSWLLAAAVFVRWRRGVLGGRGLVAVWVVGLLAAVLAFGPSQLGPLRFPVRMMPYIGLVLILTLVISASRLGLAASKARFGLLVLLSLLGTYLAIAKYPQGFPGHFAAAALVTVAVTAVILCERKRPAVLPAVVAVFTAATLGLQVVLMPASPLADFGMPTRAAEYRDPVPAAPGAVYVAGNVLNVPDNWSFTTFANGWSIAGRSSLNVYTPVGFAALGNELCVETHGNACSDGVNRIFRVDETTGLTVADLLGVEQVQIMADQGFDVNSTPPSGWHVESRNEHSVLWRRDTVGAQVGGVSWTQQGVRLSAVTVSDTQVSFVVDAAPQSGGKVVFSRLAWPGYSTDGGSISEPLRGYLLSVQVGPSDVGHTVTLSFAPPGWTTTVALGLAGILAILAWTITLLVAPQLRRRQPEKP